MEWDADDRAKALAFAIEKSDRCALCGTAPWEWEENKRAYYPVEHLCPGCYAKDSLMENTGSMPGTSVRLVASGSQESAKRIVQQRKDAERERGDAER